MRRVSTQNGHPAAGPRSSDSGGVTNARRARRHHGTTTGNSSRGNRSNSSPLSFLFLGFMALLVLADLFYLFNVSVQSLADRANKHQDNTEGAVEQDFHETHGHHLQMAPIPDPGEEQPLDDEDGDKGPIFEILKQAGIYKKDLDQATIDALPTWTTIQLLFGKAPRIYGLDTCERFRNSTDPTIRFFGIAGTFNTGTNLLSELMIQNCQITERMNAYGHQSKGMRWQVPWGKHYPASYREQHATKTDKTVPFDHSLPLVTIRHPYSWMQSMCRHPYAASWKHSKEHCPNLVPTPEDDLADGKTDQVPVTVKYSKEFSAHHDSLAHFWSDWYHLYYDANFPRIIVRFEDLLFYGKEVTETLCECGGGVPREDRRPGGFMHISESAKLGTSAHGKHKTDLVGALIKYGNQDHLVDQMTPEDLEKAKTWFNPDIMKTFDYSHPKPKH